MKFKHFKPPIKALFPNISNVFSSLSLGNGRAKGFAYNLFLAILIFIFVSSLLPIAASSAQSTPSYIRKIRVLESEDTGIHNPVGLAFSANSGFFQVIEAKSKKSVGTDVVKLPGRGISAGTTRLASLIDDPINIVFDDKFDRLLVLDSQTNQLLAIQEKTNGDLIPGLTHRYEAKSFGVNLPGGITVNPQDGTLFILDLADPSIIRITPDANGSFDHAVVSHISLRSSGLTGLRGIAYYPATGNLEVLVPVEQKLYELNGAGEVVAFRDLSGFGLQDPQGIVFAPSGDTTDASSQMSLYIADTGQVTETNITSSSVQTSGQIMELSLVQPASLPSGTTLLPSTLIRTFNTSNNAWSPSSPDPSGIDYWPLTGGFIIDDSEVDEMSSYFTGKNIYLSTLSGSLTGTCSTTTLSRSGWSNEPTGIAVNPNNNNIFITDDDKFKVFEVSLGPDGNYCTADDTVTSVSTTIDTEDVAYGNNTLFIAGGADAEVVEFDLGPNGVLGGSDDGPITHFDTAVLGFNDLEGIGYNADSNTLFIVSTSSGDRYLGEITTSGTLLRAYDLSFMGTASNIRSDVAYAPSSQNPAVKNIYIVSRGVDNGTDPNENDGKVWEISIGNPPPIATKTNTLTAGPSPTYTNTPTNTATPTSTITFTPTQPPSGNPLYASFGSNGTVGGVSFADEDILRFNGTSWSVYFDGSNAGVGSADVVAVDFLDSSNILMTFDRAITIGSLSITPRDIVKFQAASVGLNNTAGTFSIYFHGSDVGMSATSENIDTIATLPDGRILISTTGNPSMVSGAKDEDILVFTPTALGATTSGTWAMYLKGSNVGLSDSSSEDTDAVDFINGNIYLSTAGSYSVNGSTGAGEDVFTCIPSGSGSTTTCTYSPSLYFDGSTWGLSGNNLDGFDFLTLGPIPTNTPTNTPKNTPTPTNTFTPTATFTATFTPTVGPSPTLTDTPAATNTPTNTPTPTNTHTPTATFTATSTSAVTDLIFIDGFESGNFSAWSASVTNGGNLSVDPGTAISGNYGLQAAFTNTTGMYVRDDSPNAESRYRVHFYFNPNSISMANGSYIYLLQGHDPSNRVVLFVQFYRSSTGYQIRARAYDSGLANYVNTPYVTISNTVHTLEVDWGNDGHLIFWIDGVEQASLSGINSSIYTIESVRVGAPYMSGTISGSYFIDDFESRKQNYIGP